MTPLHWAVERGCCGTVETLLKHGANPNMESKFDKTPLEIASENGRPDIFEILQVRYTLWQHMVVRARVELLCRTRTIFGWWR